MTQQSTSQIAEDPTAGPQVRRSILLVDDSRLQRRILGVMVARWGYHVLEAASGLEALEIFRRERPALIVSDWMMPGMDGLDFCRAIRAEGGTDYAYFVLLTSKSEKGEIARGLDAGADDFLTKPVNADELRARLTAGERILRMQEELQAKNRLIADTLAELRGLYDAIDNDLKQAKKIQEALIPDPVTQYGRNRVSLFLKPCGHVGGDLVGRFVPEPGKLCFYSIDVSGHGITSAMMTARVSGYLSNDFPEQNVAMEQLADGGFRVRDPVDVAQRLNHRLAIDVGVVEYFTMAFALADLRTGVIRIVQAGHPHPLVLRADGRAEFIGEGGVPIGLFPGAHYHAFETRLAPGDSLLLYSDGFTEARMPGGEMLEPEGLVDLLAGLRGTPGAEKLPALYRALSDRAGPGMVQDDDLSAVLFDFSGPG